MLADSVAGEKLPPSWLSFHCVLTLWKGVGSSVGSLL